MPSARRQELGGRGFGAQVAKYRRRNIACTLSFLTFFNWIIIATTLH